jgi:signal peptidase I
MSVAQHNGNWARIQALPQVWHECSRGPSFPEPRSFGTAIRVLISLAVIGLLVNTWCVQGLFAPVIVASESMAPALLGPHRQWQCAACAQEFVSNTESLATLESPGVCPNCGALNDAQRGIDRRGDRVFIDRAAFLWRAPRRGEVVVFHSPDDPNALCVKRIAGLPGETVEIEDGDVLVHRCPATQFLDEPLRSVAASKHRLGSDEYFVLGDNSSHSIDSRVWTPRGAGVFQGQIVGRAIKW